MEISHMLPQKMIQIIPTNSNKAPLIQTKHNGAYPDKEVELIQSLTTTSPEFHSTKLKNKDMCSDTWKEVNLIKYNTI